MKKALLLQSSLPLVLGCTLALFARLATQPSLTLVHAAAADTPSGAVLFNEKGCAHCHGANGIGIPGKGPSLLTVGKRLQKDAIQKQIQDGGQRMPPFGDALQPDELTALVDMLAKQKKAPKHLPPPVSTPTQPNPTQLNFR